MVICRIFLIFVLSTALLYTILGLYVCLSEYYKFKKKKKENACIHVPTDCEDCISQSGCALKNNNVVSVREEQL